MPKKGLTVVKVTFMTMTSVTLVTAVKFDYAAVEYLEATTARGSSWSSDGGEDGEMRLCVY